MTIFFCDNFQDINPLRKHGNVDFGVGIRFRKHEFSHRIVNFHTSCPIQRDVQLLDADAISMVEALPVLLAAPKTILIGDPHNPSHDYLPIDAFHEEAITRSAFFQESILTGNPHGAYVQRAGSSKCWPA